MDLLFFLIQAFIITLSGVMAHGPVTTTAIAIGTRRQWAGTFIAIGHAIIEFPLMILIILGADRLFKTSEFRMTIGLAGGILLLIMAGQILISLKKTSGHQDTDALIELLRS